MLFLVGGKQRGQVNQKRNRMGSDLTWSLHDEDKNVHSTIQTTAYVASTYISSASWIDFPCLSRKTTNLGLGIIW